MQKKKRLALEGECGVSQPCQDRNPDDGLHVAPNSDADIRYEHLFRKRRYSEERLGRTYEEGPRTKRRQRQGMRSSESKQTGLSAVPCGSERLVLTNCVLCVVCSITLTISHGEKAQQK